MKDLKKSIDAMIICAQSISSDDKYDSIFQEIIECLRKLQTLELRQECRKNKPSFSTHTDKRRIPLTPEAMEEILYKTETQEPID